MLQKSPKILIHLSDLHFGKVNEALVDPLLLSIRIAKPDLIVVSGDLTQRATKREFAEAAAFLKRLPRAPLVVPGNHDIPLYNVAARFFRPLRNYTHFIGDILEPSYNDNHIAVVGINTAHSFTFKDGRVRKRQIAKALSVFEDAPRYAVKIVVSHHPFDFAEAMRSRKLVRKAGMAMDLFAKGGVDLFLGGHFHRPYIGTTATRYQIKGYQALVVQAGSTISTRQRGEIPSYNLLRISHKKISVTHMGWNGEEASFSPGHTQLFEKRREGWMPIAK